MPFPNIDYCLVCEVARAEVGNKLMILGFYGLAPNVDIFVDDFTAPLNLTFVMGIAIVGAAVLGRRLPLHLSCAYACGSLH